jgi:hypothetical protein
MRLVNSKPAQLDASKYLQILVILNSFGAPLKQGA